MSTSESWYIDLHFFCYIILFSCAVVIGEGDIVYRCREGRMLNVCLVVANFAAYTFAPPILVTPLGAISVLIGSVAPCKL